MYYTSGATTPADPTSGDTHTRTGVAITVTTVFKAKVIGCPSYQDSAVGTQTYTNSGGRHALRSHTTRSRTSYTCSGGSFDCRAQTIPATGAGNLLVVLSFIFNPSSTSWMRPLPLVKQVAYTLPTVLLSRSLPLEQ